MPSSNGENDKKIVAAVREGKLDEAILDRAVERLLTIIYRFEDNKNENAVWDLEKDHEIAKKIAEETIVLLKNDNNILPLKTDANVAFIGKYALKPRYQGGGSSHINSKKVTSALDSVEKYTKVTYAQGFDDKEDVTDEKLGSNPRPPP